MQRPRYLGPWLVLGGVWLSSCADTQHAGATAAVSSSEAASSGTAGDTSTSDASTTDASTSGPGVMTTTVGSSTSGASDSADTTGEPDTTAAETTTEPIEPGCGNGVLEPGEDCDDGNDNPDDGCFNCAFDQVIFVTSEGYPGNKLDGLVGADARCRMLAALAGLKKEFSFKAWLSTADESAASRMLHRSGRYVRTDGTVLAYGWDELTSGTLRAPIDRDEYGMFNPAAYAWTGTLANGEPALDSDFCDDWHGPAFFSTVGAGQTGEQDERWSFSYEVGCGGDRPLYCVEN